MGNRPFMPDSNLYGPSENIWGNFPVDQIMAGDRSAGFGFHDDFTRFAATTLYDGYIILDTATGAITQVASEENHPGIIRLATLADNDEAVLQLGNGLDVGPYRMGADAFAFEAYVRFDAEAIVAGDHSFFIGMASGGAAGAAIANLLFTASDILYDTTLDCCGFCHLAGDAVGTALDAVYKASTEAVTDGAVNTDLDTVQTLVALTWYKLGFLYLPHPRRCAWFVDGVEVCAVNEVEIVEDEFPDASTAFMQPTLGMRGADAPDAYMEVDWMRCMQFTGL